MLQTLQIWVPVRFWSHSYGSFGTLHVFYLPVKDFAFSNMSHGRHWFEYWIKGCKSSFFSPLREKAGARTITLICRIFNNETKKVSVTWIHLHTDTRFLTPPSVHHCSENTAYGLLVGHTLLANSSFLPSQRSHSRFKMQIASCTVPSHVQPSLCLAETC